MPVLNTFHGEADHWTWESSHGIRHRIDYVLSRQWIANHALTSDVIPCLDKIVDFKDHVPVVVTFRWQATHTRRISSHKRLDPEAFKDPEKVGAFKQALKEIPGVPWSVPPSEHHLTVTSQVNHAATEAFGVAPRRARKPHITKATLDLITTRRGVIRVLKKWSQASGLSDLRPIEHLRGRWCQGDVLGFALQEHSVPWRPAYDKLARALNDWAKNRVQSDVVFSGPPVSYRH